MRKTITATIIAAAATVAMGSAGIAAASTHTSGASGIEHFQLMTTSPTATTSSVIAYGVFTGAAIDHQVSNNVDRFVFSNGAIRVHHSNGKGPQTFNPKTCLLTINQHGTFLITHGTGKFAGISGHGTYHLSILAVGARSHGKCSQTKPPVAFHQVINASGPVSLP
jgi:hypothetical protein